MAKRGEPRSEVAIKLRAHVQDHHGVYAGIDLGVIVCTLWDAPQGIELGQQHA